MAFGFCSEGGGEQQILSIFRGISEFSRPLSHLQSRLNASSGIAPFAEVSAKKLKEPITKAKLSSAKMGRDLLDKSCLSKPCK